MAVVIAVIALLLSSILVPLATQVEERRIADTRRILDDAREALLGFAIANGRLPCPASPSSKGSESDTGVVGICTNSHNGFLPAATLGLTPTDAEGFLVDPWGNRIRYAVTDWRPPGMPPPPPTFTTPNGISTRFQTGQPLSPDLEVCSTSVGIAGTPPSCSASSRLTTSAPAVIYSPGSNGVTGSTSADEIENGNGNRVFVSRAPGTVGAAGGTFDDVVTWISPNVLYSRMVAAGKLP